MSTQDVSSVSVVISTHNRHELLSALLEDLRRQQTSVPELDVIVVDSVHGEDSRPVVHAARERGLDVRHLLGPNILAAKRNVGAEDSAADLLIFLDDDLRVDPDFVQAHARSHDLSANACVSGAISFPPEWVVESNYYAFKAARHMSGPPRTAVRVPPHRFVAMNHSIRREKYFSIGGFDASFERYGAEDLDFGIRCVEAGIKLQYQEDAEAVHWEVRMSPVVYFDKVYRAAYFGTTQLVAKHGPRIDIPTIWMTVIGLQQGVRSVIPRGTQMLAHPRLVAMLVKTLEASDHRRRLYSPLAFKIATILTHALAARDVRAQRAPRSLL